MNRRRAFAAALFVIVSWAWLSPLPASAQLTGSLIVTITSPTSGSTVSSTVTVNASVSIIGFLTVAGVQFKLDGANLGAEDTSAPYSVPWNTTTTSNGSHTLTAVARDDLGVLWTSDPVTVTVSNPDTTPPSVSLTAPANGATVSGTTTVSASASDNVGVVGVQFRLDGANLGAEDTTAPYSLSWNTTAASNGAHTLTAIARDAAGNTTTSAAVTVTVSNADTTPPSVSLTAPANGATVSGTITVSASASDNVGVVGVRFRLDGANLGAEDTTAPYSLSWNTTAASNGSHTLTAVARDAAGNTTLSAAVTVTVSNADTTPPTVSLTAPANGATVSNTITVSASASDNVGVAGVQFQLDGAPLGAEDTTAPYAVSWNTTATSNGSHTLTAVARDAAGNTTTAASVTVTVSNGAPPAGGDVFVALDQQGTPPDLQGAVLWHNPDGSLRRILRGASNGQASSVAFDAAGNIYVPHWYTSNIVERFDVNGNFLGPFGSGYNEAPSSIAFDKVTGHMYVGHADPPGDILKFDTAGNRVASFDVPTTVRGTDHIDLASDNCTMFYSSRDQNIYRYDVCTNTPLPPFNTQSLPGSTAYHLRVLPDGGVLVADSEMIVRLDASGNEIKRYFLPGESNYWGGVDHAGDDTFFWASNAATDDIVKFDLQSGAVLFRFNIGTGGFTAAGVGVRR